MDYIPEIMKAMYRKDNEYLSNLYKELIFKNEIKSFKIAFDPKELSLAHPRDVRYCLEFNEDSELEYYLWLGSYLFFDTIKELQNYEKELES